MTCCRVGNVTIGPGQPLAIIAGPCVLESRELGLRIAGAVRAACEPLSLPMVFKASFDKANRSNAASARGPGLDAGLRQLEDIGRQFGVPVTTDVHEPAQCLPTAQAVDLLQIPALLCRQTDLLSAAGEAAATHHRGVNIKKGQFMAPAEMAGPIGKVTRAGCGNIIVTERGTFFGYHRLVNDFLGLGDLLELEVAGRPWGGPVCFDATHSTQLPGAEGKRSGGRPERAALLASAATAAGVHALFIETHPDPASAASDASTMLPLAELPDLLARVSAIRRAVEEHTPAGATETAR